MRAVKGIEPLNATKALSRLSAGPMKRVLADTAAARVEVQSRVGLQLALPGINRT
jgi:hypothetical protein